MINGFNPLLQNGRMLRITGFPHLNADYSTHFGLQEFVDFIRRILFGAIHIKPLWGFRKILILNCYKSLCGKQKSIWSFEKNQHLNYEQLIILQQKYFELICIHSTFKK